MYEKKTESNPVNKYEVNDVEKQTSGMLIMCVWKLGTLTSNELKENNRERKTLENKKVEGVWSDTKVKSFSRASAWLPVINKKLMMNLTFQKHPDKWLLKHNCENVNSAKVQ